jgi:hypothetical protein
MLLGMVLYNDSSPICTSINSSSITPFEILQLQEHMVHLGDPKLHLSGWRLSISRIPNRLQTQLHNANYPSMASSLLQLYEIRVPGDLDVADSLLDNTSKANADNGYTPSPGLSPSDLRSEPQPLLRSQEQLYAHGRHKRLRDDEYQPRT